MKALAFFVVLFSNIFPLAGQALKLNELYYGTVFKSNSSSLSSATIEVFNNQDSTVSLSDYVLRLNSTTQPLPATQLLPHRHFVVTLDNISLRIGQQLELLEISSNLLVDSITPVGLTADESYARIPDGIGNWSIQKQNSLGAENRPDYVPDNYDADWTPYTVQAPFGIRDGAGAIVFKGEMWLLGGWAHGPVVSDIWKSKNGVDWEYVTTAPWPGRHQFGAMVFKGKMWVISGDQLSDVWSSEDGINWHLELGNAPWGGRYAPYVCTFGDKLWIMGGQKWETTPYGDWDYNLPIGFNDVWYSSDGVNWVEATPNAPWQPRSMINGSAVFQGKMWILGGGIKGHGVTTSEYNDVWNSEDGVNWNLVTDNAAWRPRVHLSTIVYDDKIWVTDGSPGTPAVLTNEVWSSEDGINWIELVTDNKWNARHASSLFNYDGSLWMVAGYNSSNAWRYTQPPTQYFSAATGSLSDLSTWTTGIDGTGKIPTSFDRDNQVFVVANRDSVVLSDEFRVQGRNSKIVIGTEADSVTLSLGETSVLDANVDVLSTSTLVIGSAASPTLNKLHPGSTVLYTSGSESTISSAAYYNLAIGDSKSYNIADQVAVYGKLNAGTASLNTTSGGTINAYGDLTFEDRYAFSAMPVRFLGSNRQIVEYLDSAVFSQTSIDKVDGIVEIARGPASFDHIGLHGGTLRINVPIKLHSAIDWDQRSFISMTEVSKITVESPDPGEFVLPVRLAGVRCPLIYSTESASVMTVGLVRTSTVADPAQISIPQSLRRGWYISSDVPMELTFLWDQASQNQEFSGTNIAVNMFQAGIDSTISTSSRTASVNSNIFSEETFYSTSVSLKESTTGLFIISNSRKSPNFTFSLPPEIRYGDRVRFEVTNDAGLPMQITAEGSVEVVGDSLFARAPGPFVLSAATQPTVGYVRGGADYTNEVYRALPNLQIEEIPRQQFSQGSYRVLASSTSSSRITFISDDKNIAFIRNDTLFFAGAGKTMITAMQKGNDLMEPAFATEVVEIEYDNVDPLVKLFPNPSAGKATLQVYDAASGPIQVNILGELGQSVYQTSSMEGGLYRELNFDDLANGFYILLIKTKDRQSVRKMVISR